MCEATNGSHPDRVAWYCGLIEAWTGHAPCAVAVGGAVVVSVGTHRLARGGEHAPVAVCAPTCEQALEGLANTVYQSLQEERGDGVLVGGEVVGGYGS